MRTHEICDHEFAEMSVCVDGGGGGENSVGFEYTELFCRKCGYRTPKSLYESMRAASDFSERTKSIIIDNKAGTDRFNFINAPVTGRKIQGVRIVFLIVAALLGTGTLMGIVLLSLGQQMGFIFILVYTPLSCIFWWLCLRGRKKPDRKSF